MLKRLYNKLLKNPTTVAETTETGTECVSFNFPLSFFFFRKSAFQLNAESYQATGHCHLSLCLKGSSYETIQITTAGATTAVITEKVWGEYVSVVYHILTKQNRKMSET